MLFLSETVVRVLKRHLTILIYSILMDKERLDSCVRFDSNSLKL